MFKTGQQSNDLEAPMWIVYLAIPLGSGLMCFRFLQVAWSYYWTGDLPHHNEAQVEGVEADVAGAASAAGRHGDRAPARKVAARSALILILAPILILAICLARARPASSCCRRRCAPPPSSRC